MIGGGIIFIDDKARGLHEGYLVTPIRKYELILGFNLAGAAKAILAGLVMVTCGSLIAGIPDPLNPLRLAQMLVLVVLTAPALISLPMPKPGRAVSLVITVRLRRPAAMSASMIR